MDTTTDPYTYYVGDGSSWANSDSVSAHGVPNRRDGNRRSTSSNVSLGTGDANIQNINAQATISVTLPSLEAGLFFVIANRTTGANSINVLDQAGSTLATLSADEVLDAEAPDSNGWIARKSAGTVQ